MHQDRQNKKVTKQPSEVLNDDKEKLALERQKVALEKKKLEISLYVEDFKARWQELLNFENENSRWTTLYVTSLLLVMGWIFNNIGKYGTLKDLYAASDNAYFIMGIAVVNALYTFAMAFRGYQIQQIALYQYEFIGDRLWKLTETPFNDWERYRREVFGKRRGPEPIRTAYFVMIGSLPTIVSYTIIILYWVFEWQKQAELNHWKSVRNWVSLAAFCLVTCSLILSMSTSKLNKRWDQILEEAQKKRKIGNSSKNEVANG